MFKNVYESSNKQPTNGLPKQHGRFESSYPTETVAEYLKHEYDAELGVKLLGTRW